MISRGVRLSLLDKLIQQAKKPSGIIGRIMVSIMNSAHDRQTKWGLSKLNIQKDSTVLDIGCGGGKLVSHLCEIASRGKVIGVDYSKDAVRKTISKNKKSVDTGLADIKYGSVLDLPLDSRTLDFAVAVQTHYFWEDLESSLREIKRVLKNSGTVMILSELYKMDYHMGKYNTAKSTRELLNNLNYKNIRLYENNGWMCLIGENTF